MIESAAIPTVTPVGAWYDLDVGSRATSFDGFQERIARLRSPEGLAHARDFRPRADDVIIATFPKAGTTWMQQIVHGLRTRGDMSFDEITAVTPWIELAHDAGWDLSAEQPGGLRAFKSHWNAEQLPSTCRWICLIRDPVDTMLSLYHFMNGWFLEPDAVPPDTFAQRIAQSEVPVWNYWHHLMTFWRSRHDEKLLLLSYEDLKLDHAGGVRRVARFLGLGDDDEAIEIAARQSTFEFMKAHEPQFDDHLIAKARNLDCGLPEAARSTKVRTGRPGASKDAFHAETLALLQRRWTELVEIESGLSDYGALRAALAVSLSQGSRRGG